MNLIERLKEKSHIKKELKKIHEKEDKAEKNRQSDIEFYTMIHFDKNKKLDKEISFYDVIKRLKEKEKEECEENGFTDYASNLERTRVKLLLKHVQHNMDKDEFFLLNQSKKIKLIPLLEKPEWFRNGADITASIIYKAEELHADRYVFLGREFRPEIGDDYLLYQFYRTEKIPKSGILNSFKNLSFPHNSCN